MACRSSSWEAVGYPVFAYGFDICAHVSPRWGSTIASSACQDLSSKQALGDPLVGHSKPRQNATYRVKQRLVLVHLSSSSGTYPCVSRGYVHCVPARPHWHDVPLDAQICSPMPTNSGSGTTQRESVDRARRQAVAPTPERLRGGPWPRLSPLTLRLGQLVQGSGVRGVTDTVNHFPSCFWCFAGYGPCTVRRKHAHFRTRWVGVLCPKTPRQPRFKDDDGHILC